MKRLLTILVNYWRKIKKYVRKGGVNLLIALIIWLSPSWLAFFIPSLKEFAVIWIGLVISPVVPSWAAVPLLAIIVALVRKGIVIVYHWIKDQITKLRYGAEMFTLYTVDELELILEKGKTMKKIKDADTHNFKVLQNRKRKKLIKENWETELEES